MSAAGAVSPSRPPLGGEALERFAAAARGRVVDVGSGDGRHAARLRAAGLEVTTVDRRAPADVRAEYTAAAFARPFDGAWCCHVLEHQVDPGAFLRKLRGDVRPGGLVAVTVPPAKRSLVGGHVTLWTAGVLLYQMVLAGFDCAAARVGVYGYNLSVLVARRDAALPALAGGRGDLEALARFFPVPVRQGCDGRIGNVRW